MRVPKSQGKGPGHEKPTACWGATAEGGGAANCPIRGSRPPGSVCFGPKDIRLKGCEFSKLQVDPRGGRGVNLMATPGEGSAHSPEEGEPGFCPTGSASR